MSDSLARWLRIIGKLFRVFAQSYAQVVRDDRVRFLDQNGIVHMMHFWRAEI